MAGMLTTTDPLILAIAKELNNYAFNIPIHSPEERSARQRDAMNQAWRVLRIVDRAGRLLTAPDEFEVP